LYWLAVIIFPSYRYEIEGSFLVIRRQVLGRIPFGTARVPLADISAVEQTLGRIPWGATLRGRPLAREGVVLVLQARHRLRKLYVTPDNPEAFVSQLVEFTTIMPPGPPRAIGTVLNRVPVWVADLLAMISGGLTIPLLVVPRSVVNLPGGIVVVGVGSALILAMVFLMVFDSARRPAKNRSPWFTLWPTAIIIIFPLAWLYYMIEWRPRHRE
jgi:hypothetical protein